MNRIQALDELWKRKVELIDHEITYDIQPGAEVRVSVCFRVNAQDFDRVETEYRQAQQSTPKPMNQTKPTNPKAFDASKFVSNEKTPVVDQYGIPVHILTTSGRDPNYRIVGYHGEAEHVGSWRPDQLRFAPVKRTVEVDVFLYKGETVFISLAGGNESTVLKTKGYVRHLGTIKGEVDA